MNTGKTRTIFCIVSFLCSLHHGINIFLYIIITKCSFFTIVASDLLQPENFLTNLDFKDNLLQSAVTLSYTVVSVVENNITVHLLKYYT